MKTISTAAGGFVPLGAAATLIGSSTAESLILGNRGTSGLPWATLSFFGVLSVVKTCIAATSPDCIRDAIGVRSHDVDSAMGMSIGLGSKPTLTGSAPVGVTCDINPKPSGKTAFETGRIVYTFDQHTLNLLEAVPELEPGTAVKTYTYVDDPWARDRFKKSLWWDGIALSMSLVKILEMVVLWRQGASQLCWLTGLSWASFFIGALILQILRFITNAPGDNHRFKVDVLAGELPTLYEKGGKRRVLLGLPKHFRCHYAWKLVWSFGAVVALASVIGTWLLLEKQDQAVAYTWVLFQVVWLAARSIFFYVSGRKEDAFRHPLVLHLEWQNTKDSKVRVKNLVFALSKYEMYSHSRGFHSYKEDAVAINAWNGIIGDTLLYSACWMLGSKLSAMDLHDSCIVKLKGTGKEVNIPAVRALSEIPRPENDEEAIEKLYPPQGGTNTGINIMWWYWIPCGAGLWLEVKSIDMEILGQRTAKVLSDEGVDASLKGPKIRISMRDVKEVRSQAEKSMEAAGILGILLS